MNTKKAADNSFLNTLKNGFTNSPFEKAGKDYNIAGALLFGAGTGLTSWALSRMLGLRGGASLGASILAGLAGTHVALSSQSGQGPFSMKYWDDLTGGKPVPPASKEQPKIDMQEKKKTAEAEVTASQMNVSELTEAINSGQFRNAATGKVEQLTPGQLRVLEQAKDEKLEKQYFGKRIDELSLDERDDAIKSYMNLAFNGFRRNNRLKNEDGSINMDKAIQEMANSGDPMWTKLNNHFNRLKVDKEEAEAFGFGTIYPHHTAYDKGLEGKPIMDKPQPRNLYFHNVKPELVRPTIKGNAQALAHAKEIQDKFLGEPTKLPAKSTLNKGPLPAGFPTPNKSAISDIAKKPGQNKYNQLMGEPSAKVVPAIINSSITPPPLEPNYPMETAFNQPASLPIPKLNPPAPITTLGGRR